MGEDDTLLSLINIFKCVSVSRSVGVATLANLIGDYAVVLNFNLKLETPPCG